jgi:hypothetical protein
MVPHSAHQQHQGQSDSVLAPNHFVAAEEKQRNRWTGRHRHPYARQVSSDGDDDDEEEQDTDFEGNSRSVDDEGSSLATDDRKDSGDAEVSAAASSSSTAAPSSPSSSHPPGSSNAGSGLFWLGGRGTSSPPQTPPSATPRHRGFVGPPRPSPGNIV